MSRFRDRQRQNTLFRGSERTRLMTMIVMLGVIAMLMSRANDPNTWKMFGAKEEFGDAQLTRSDVDRLEQEAAARITHRSTEKHFAANRPLALAAVDSPAGEPAPQPNPNTNSNPDPQPVAAAPAEADDKPAEAPNETEAAKPATEAAKPEASPAPEKSAADQPIAEAPDDDQAPPVGPPTTEPGPTEPDPRLAAPGNSPSQFQPVPQEPRPDDAEPLEQEYKPTDLDPEELEGAREEFEAVTDKAPLVSDEMNSYWRLMKWSRNQTVAEMRKRARGDITFNQLFQHASKYRGQLVELKLHLRQSSRYDAPKNELGVKQVYELLGWNDNSRPYSYFLITDDVPADMPIGQSIFEEGTFVGYFYKLMSYEDHEGKYRSAPIIIGRLVRRPSQTMIKQQHDAVEKKWTWILGGSMLAIIAIAWLTWKMLPKTASRRGLPLNRRDGVAEETIPIETWLERAEDGSPLPATPADATVEDGTSADAAVVAPLDPSREH